jgi:hypothetical protein
MLSRRSEDISTEQTGAPLLAVAAPAVSAHGIIGIACIGRFEASGPIGFP